MSLRLAPQAEGGGEPSGFAQCFWVWPLPLSGSVPVSDLLARAGCCLSCVLWGQAAVGVAGERLGGEEEANWLLTVDI